MASLNMQTERKWLQRKPSNVFIIPSNVFIIPAITHGFLGGKVLIFYGLVALLYLSLCLGFHLTPLFMHAC